MVNNISDRMYPSLVCILHAGSFTKMTKTEIPIVYGQYVRTRRRND